jgi:hypothetical protein
MLIMKAHRPFSKQYTHHSGECAIVGWGAGKTLVTIATTA